MTFGRTNFGFDAHATDHTRLPANAGANPQRDTVIVQFHHLGEVSPERFAHQSACFVEQIIEILGLKCSLSERRKDVLLPE